MSDLSSLARTKSGGSASSLVIGLESVRSVTETTCESQQRFYRSLDTAARPAPEPDPETHIPLSNTLNNQESLEMTRLEALHTLDTCRHVIASLELTRLRKSREGLYHWMAFWERLYERAFASVLSTRVMAALYKVDELFRAVSFDLHQLAQKTELAIVGASSEKEILHILERMENEVCIRRKRRRRKAQNILLKMRLNIESIPVKVNDELFDDMKRGVFALDIYGDYHPGDERAEQTERMWSQHFIGQSVGLVAVSPYLYRQWRESATSDSTSLPLTAYSSNTRWADMGIA
ncbi:hypothetical protein BDV18DRAFT_163535 [Aspergillus unguis]